MSREQREPPDIWMNADEVAQWLGMSRDWVYDRALARELPSYKFGGKRLFLYSELMEAVKRFREGS